jgi:hypothetical protein
MNRLNPRHRSPLRTAAPRDTPGGEANYIALAKADIRTERRFLRKTRKMLINEPISVLERHRRELIKSKLDAAQELTKEVLRYILLHGKVDEVALFNRFQAPPHAGAAMVQRVLDQSFAEHIIVLAATRTWAINPDLKEAVVYYLLGE